MVKSLQSLLVVSLWLSLTACPPAEPGPARTPPRPRTQPARTAPPVARQPAPPRPRRAGPPLARRQAIVDVLHGVRVADPYRWLENAKDPEVKTWVKRMNAYARKKLAALPGRDRLAKRLAELSYVEWVSAPRRRGRRYFFSRRHKDKEKVVYYWREGEKGRVHVLLDPNTLSKDGSVSVKGIYPDYQGRRVAYKLSHNNADESVLYVMDVATGRIHKKDTIKGAKYAQPAWTPNGRAFYYTRLPVDAKIPTADRPGYAEIYLHRLGTDPAKDRLVYGKTGDPRKFIWPELSRDGRWLFVYVAHGWARTDVYLKDLRRGRRARFVPFAISPKGTKALYSVYAWKGWIYIHTNEGAPRYRLLRVRATRPGRKGWKEIIPQQKDAVLEDFAVRGNHLSLRYLRHATTELRINTLRGKAVRTVSFPGLGTAYGLVGTPEDDVAYYAFSSYIRPTTIYRTSVRKGGRSVYFQVKLPIDPKPYTVEQVWYPSKDGTKISMFLIHRKQVKRDGKNPVLLYGYGGFNVNLTPGFRASWFVWLEQGGMVAIPNLRGGGEYGEDWHRAGMLLKKQNTFDDFVWAAKWLIQKRYTRPARLAIRGGSNGGLLVGAAMVQAPRLFRAVACYVPLLDMVRYHKFGSGKTWIGEYGSAEDPAQFKAIYAYSPYHHVRKGTAYPALIMMSADSDDRVDPMHARKFTAAIRWATTSGLPVWLRVETKAGHGGGDMVKKRVDATADEFAFLLHELGVKPR